MKYSNKFRNPLTFFLFTIILVVSCQKDVTKGQNSQEEIATAANSSHGHLQQTKTFSSEVARKWHDLQLRILRITGANPYGLNGNRYFAYFGIALYESVVPGMPNYQSLYGQLTNMPAMPSTEPGRAYHWPATANSALASLTKNFYTLASSAHKASIDSLENALKNQFQQQVNEATFQRSENFGKQIAQLVFDWSKTDGALTVWPVYTMTSDITKWRPVAPNPTTVSAPYWGYNRLFVPGSTNNTASPLPPPYSTDPNSSYYQMVKEVYDISQTLTADQIATALYFRDNPGFQAGTHYQYIFNQVMNDEDPQLDLYALAQAKVAIAMAESQIDCWKKKYDVLTDRPTRYIRDVMGHTGWSSLLAMPNHPDFPSGHSQTGGSFAEVMTSLFGNDYNITLHTYDNLGMAPRPYNSFNEMAEDIGRSRVFGGIHYTYSCTEGMRQGQKIAQNILNTLKFKKD
ncbi:MAG TPA: vanadium-dependent haloperoxidase [Chitinophagaceae bacterium]